LFSSAKPSGASKPTGGNGAVRVISFVPSWTETLIEAGVEVVGRTRFCIHPKEKVKNIPAVGGTKDCDWEKAALLKPNLVIFDEEENLKSMAESCPFPWTATHVSGISDLPGELRKLAGPLGNEALLDFSRRWQRVTERAPKFSPAEVPGVLQWLRRPGPEVKSFAYVIWKNPWMAVGPETFIGSIFASFGLQNHFSPGVKYPKFAMEEIPSDLLLLFSSEPFPFGRQTARLEELPYPSALVDGEKYGWFGLRSLRFLESLAPPA
jgi:hypothetical protein